MKRSYPIEGGWNPRIIAVPGVAAFVQDELGAQFGLDRTMLIPWKLAAIKAGATADYRWRVADNTLTILAMPPTGDLSP